MASLLTSVKVPPGILGEGGGKPGQFLAIADEEKKDRGESEVPEAPANPTISSATSSTPSNAKPKQQTIVVPPLPNLQPWSLEDESPKPTTRDSSAPFSLGTPAPASKPETNGAVPDLHLLTPEEIQLCNALHIQPKPYLVIKEHLIKEALKNGGVLRRKDVKGSIGRGRFDNVKVGRIWEFMVRSGWIGKGGG
ncbi:Transcriptional adapter ada2 [Ascosphaera atra]|nr:Transcriptional adapter ada2 [Ascosphaera atra]